MYRTKTQPLIGTIHLNGEFWGVLPILINEISNLKVPLVIIYFAEKLEQGGTYEF